MADTNNRGGAMGASDAHKAAGSKTVTEHKSEKSVSSTTGDRGAGSATTRQTTSSDVSTDSKSASKKDGM